MTKKICLSLVFLITTFYFAHAQFEGAKQTFSSPRFQEISLTRNNGCGYYFASFAIYN